MKKFNNIFVPSPEKKNASKFGPNFNFKDLIDLD